MTAFAKYLERNPVGDWAKEGACVGMDPDLFFPHVGLVRREAREACARCPVREECLQHALVNHETFGLWGGTSDRQRVKIGYAPRPRLTATSSPCGTDSGYRRHHRDGEPACDACRAAHTAANRERAERRRAS